MFSGGRVEAHKIINPSVYGLPILQAIQYTTTIILHYIQFSYNLTIAVFCIIVQSPEMENSPSQTIIVNIRKLLESNDMSAMDLARKVEISPSTLTNLKKGGNISVDKVSLIAKHFHYEPWVLVCTNFSTAISQSQYNELLEVFASPNLTDAERSSVIDYCRFQSIK